MHIIAYSTCWECKQIKEKLVCFDGLEKWQDNAEICLDCLVAAQQSGQRTECKHDVGEWVAPFTFHCTVCGATIQRR